MARRCFEFARLKIRGRPRWHWVTRLEQFDLLEDLGPWVWGCNSRRPAFESPCEVERIEGADAALALKGMCANCRRKLREELGR